MLKIENNGQLIKTTNYFETEHAAKGLFYLSLNAGAFRLLVPAKQKDAIKEFRTAKDIVISRGPYPDLQQRDAIEILFDDHSDNPFSIHLSAGQVDRFPVTADADKEWVFSAWTNGPALAIEMLCHYRIVKKLPCLKPLK